MFFLHIAYRTKNQGVERMKLEPFDGWRPQRRAMLGALAGVMLPGFLRADTHVGDETLLEVGAEPESGPAVEFDLTRLDTLQTRSFQTSTPWTEGVQRFSGPSLVDVLAAAAFVGNQVRAEALNSYHAVLAVPEPQDPYPILCTRIDGRVLSVRDKGPIWIMYPFDSDERYRTETFFGASVWHLVRLVVLADG